MQNGPGRYYVDVLKNRLIEKQRENPLYSLRAFSKYLGVHSSTLSQVLNGKRDLPYKRAQGISEKLQLSPQEKTLFLESFFRSKTNIDNIPIEPLDRRFVVEESQFRVLAEWEHFCVLELFDLENFDFSKFGASQDEERKLKEQVAIKLGVGCERVERVLDNLLSAGLIEKTASGELKKVHEEVKTSEDIQSPALKKSHKETVKMAGEKLDEIGVELRDYSSTTIAIDIEKLTEAKTIIREFRQKMAALLRDGRKTDVYQLAIQFFPLTNPQANPRENSQTSFERRAMKEETQND